MLKLSMSKLSLLLSGVSTTILIAVVLLGFYTEYGEAIRILIVQGIFGFSGMEAPEWLLYLFVILPFLVIFLINWLLSYIFLKFLMRRDETNKLSK